MMSDEQEAMQALLGFSAFGGSSRTPKKRASQSYGTTEAVVQLMPGTELAANRDALPEGCRLRAAESDGVLLLVSCEKDATAALKAALSSQVSADEEEEDLLPQASRQLLEQVQEQRQSFGGLDDRTFRWSRDASNPYEAIGRHRFLNRSAMKLVNMDHVFRLTPSSIQSEVFTFADVCGGPGGFSEYLLWKHSQLQQPVHGFGISLRGTTSCDWRLPPLNSLQDHAKQEFEIYDGVDGTGDVYKLANVHSFRDRIREKHPDGVDLVVADGGFPDARDQSDQEAAMIRLVLAEILTMLSILKPRGKFVCKTFEITSALMLQLVWILYQCFEELTIVKPVTSRPASSERYIVALNRHEAIAIDSIIALLESRLESAEASEKMPLLFSNDVLMHDAAFLEFMTCASDMFAKTQINACKRLLECASAPRKRKTRSVDPSQYYKLWTLDEPAHKSAGVHDTNK